MNKKILSSFLVLALFVGVLGLISTTSVWGAAPTTTTDISNEAPAFTVAASDNGSDGTTPTDVGSNVTFTATAVDPNLDDYYLAICKTSAVTAGTATYPTCDSGKWPEANPTATTSGNAATETYTALVGDSESNDWYAFVCDGNGTPGACSLVGTSDSFNVNHAGTFGSVLSMDNADTVSDTYSVTGNGIVLTSIATGITAYSLGLNLVLTDDGVTNCNAALPNLMAPLITGTSPNFALTCDLDISAVGTDPVTGARLAAAITDGTTTTIDDVITAAAEGAGTDTLPAGTSTLSDLQAIEPGNTIGFILPDSALADPDTDTAQDNMTMYICSGTSDQGGVTSAFNYSANTCTGGTLLCSSSAVNPVTTDATCTDTQAIISVPTANASYNVKIYVEDTHDFPATGTETQTYTVADVEPIVTGYSTGDSLIIGVGGSDALTYSATMTDNNGDNDITDFDFVFWDDDANSGALERNCSADDNDCIRIDNENPASLTVGLCTTATRSTAGSGKTADGTDNSLTISCDFTAYFNANYSSNWEVSATITDFADPVDGADSDVNNAIGSLSGIGVKLNEDTIAYGTVALGGTSSVDTTTMENLGNQILDVLVTGDDMCTDYPTCSGSQIDSTQQELNLNTSSWTWGAGADAGFALVNSPAGTTPETGCANRDMAVRAVNDTGTEDEAFYWMIKIPAAQDSGSYTGVNTFATTASGTCSGTLY